MDLRRLNTQGLAAFNAYLDNLETNDALPVPTNLLEDPAHTEAVSPAVALEVKPFGSRFAAARYLFETFSTAGLPDIDRDKGLWAWVTLLYFDEVCPIK